MSRNKKQSDYWKRRFEAMEDDQYQKSQKYYETIKEAFRRATNDIQMDIEHWYSRLARNNNISYAAAKKLLSKSELNEFHWTVETYIRHGEENALNQRWMKELENASARYHISYLQAMKLQVQQHAELLFAEYEGSTTEFLNKTFGNQYQRTAYEIAKGTGIGSNLTQIDTRRIDTLIKKPWAADGENFSGRIWKNKDKLVSTLHMELSQSIIRGEDPIKAINRLSDTMEVSKKQAGRLIMTESAAIAATAQKQCFSELGVEQYEIVVTLDSHTCNVCQDFDGKVFRQADFEVGLTAPPFHPRCRCCQVPYFNDEFTKKEMRAARNTDGKTYYVPADMTYHEWKKESIDKAETAEYRIRSHVPGQNTTQDRLTVNEAIASTPQKVQDALHHGTIVDVGKDGASQYDYNHDILYVAAGAEKKEVIHEIGHMVENKMLREEKVTALRKQIVGMVSPLDLKSEVYYDTAGNSKEVYFLLRDDFVSEYQGRIYVDDIFDAFESDGTFKDALLWEFISEAFREYIEFPDDFKQKYEEFYNLFEEVFQ